MSMRLYDIGLFRLHGLDGFFFKLTCPRLIIIMTILIPLARGRLLSHRYYTCINIVDKAQLSLYVSTFHDRI